MAFGSGLLFVVVLAVTAEGVVGRAEEAAAAGVVVVGRDPLKWPFAEYSIWNLPLGDGAVFVPAKLNFSQSPWVESDPDVLFLDPTQPLTDFWYSSAGWQPGHSRCLPDEPHKLLLTAPFPVGYVVPDYGNQGTAILMPDHTTIKQTQPVCRCNATSWVTTLSVVPDVSIYGEGIHGAHGGSGLSAIGGTVRLGEFLPNSNGSIDPVRHVLKSNLWAALNYYREGCNRSTCYRWPAWGCDGYYCTGPGTYGGSNPSVRPGSLLALDFSIDINKLPLLTTPAKSFAWTLQNYGLYLVDDSYWNAIAIETENSPAGSYTTQFQAAWKLDFHSNNNPWQHDILLLYSLLSVVDNWNEDLYDVVKASNGKLGAGGGPARQAWAPSFTTNGSK